VLQHLLVALFLDRVEKALAEEQVGLHLRHLSASQPREGLLDLEVQGLPAVLGPGRADVGRAVLQLLEQGGQVAAGRGVGADCLAFEDQGGSGVMQFAFFLNHFNFAFCGGYAA
jgi:hypothetical protein